MANEVEIIVTSKNLAATGFKEAETQAKGSASKIGDAFKGIAVIAAGTALLGFAKSALAEATEAQEVGKQTEAAIKSTGGAANVTAAQVGDLSTKLSNLVGVDDELIQSGSNILLTFTNVRNEAGKGNDVFNQASKTVLDMTAALNKGAITQDGVKASSIQLGKALNDPIKGITALTKVGVTFTDAQKDAIKQDVARGDSLGAQKIILGELNKEFGGSAEAAVTPAKKADVAWKNFQETMGGYILPIVGAVATALTSLLPHVADLVAAIVNWATHSSVLNAIVSTTVSVVKDIIGFVADHATSFQALAVGITAVVIAMTAWNVITKIISVSQAIMNAIMDANPIGIIILAIIGLVAAFVYLWNHSAAFRDFWIGLWNGIKSAALGVANWFTKSLPHFFQVAWDDIKTIIATFGKILDTYVVNPYLTVVGFILTGAAKAFGWIPGLGGKLKTAAKEFDAFKKNVNDALSGIKDQHVAVVVHVSGNGANLVVNGRVTGTVAHGGLIGAAASGKIGNGRTWVGEHGPELVDLPPGALVHSNPDSERMVADSSGGGGSTRIQLEWVGGNAGDEFMTWLRKNIRIKGGRGTDSVQKALGY